MSQPPDLRPPGSLPSAGKHMTGKIPQLPGSVPSDSTGNIPYPRPTGAFPSEERYTTGKMRLSPADSTGKIPAAHLSTSMRMPVVIPAEKKKAAGSRKTGSREAAPGQPVPPQTTAQQTEPGTLPLPEAKRFASPRRLDKRITWYILLGVGLMSIVLSFIFTIPLNTGQQHAATVAQSITNLIQNGSFSAQPQNQGQGGNQNTKATAGFPTSGLDGTRLFNNSSPWNVPIGKNVELDPNSSAMANELANGFHVPAMFDFGMPIYTSTANDPTYTVQNSDGDGAFDRNQPMHIPASAAPSPGSDHWLFIYDKTKNVLFEMWDTQKDGNTWTTQTGDAYTPTGDGVLQVDGSQQDGNGASYFGGVITAADMARGSIDHALSLASQYTGSAFRYPMRASDGGDGDVPMGARVQLNPAVNCNTLPGASKGEKMICQAMETYGGYMRDTGGVALSMYFEGENLNDPHRQPPDGSPGNAGNSNGAFGKVGLSDGQGLDDIPWNKLQVLKSWNSFTALGASQKPANPLSAPLALAPNLADSAAIPAATSAHHGRETRSAQTASPARLSLPSGQFLKLNRDPFLRRARL